MAIRRITLSVPAAVAGRIKRAAGSKPVSAWVTDLIEEHLDEASLKRQWEDFCRDVKVTRQDDQKANALFKRLTRRASRRGAA